MRICMVGAGVIGCIYGQVFSEVGHEVTHFVRHGRGELLREGLPIDLLDARSADHVERSLTYRPQVVERLDPAAGYDLVVAGVRHYQVPYAAAALAKGAGDAEVLFLSNLWSSFRPLQSQLGTRYSWGFPMAGGGFIDGRLEAALLDEVQLGAPSDGDDGRQGLVTELFEQCGLTVTPQQQILDWLWVHFALEAGFVGTALKAASVEDFLGDIDFLTEAVLAVRDALQVVQARGVRIDLRPEALMYFAPERAVAESIYDLYAEDVAARRILERRVGSPEMQRIYHDVVASGREQRVSMPVLGVLAPHVYGRRLPAA